MIRVAQQKDLAEITEIYNQAIDAGFQTAYTTRLDPAQRLAWFEEHKEVSYPLFVYEESGQVIGWVSISGYRPDRGALRFAAEISYFVHKDHWGKGMGGRLLQHGLAACKERGYKTVIAIILEPNTASAILLEKYGFEKWAYLPNIADFSGVECSQVYYGLKM